MKKIIIAVCLITAALVACCSFASCSCGGSDNSEPKTAAYEIVNDEKFQKELDAAKEYFADTMEIDVFSEGHTIVSKYTFLTQIPDDQLDNAYAQIDESSLKEAAKEMLKNYASKYDDPELAVCYRYYNHDGALLKQFNYTRAILSE